MGKSWKTHPDFFEISVFVKTRPINSSESDRIKTHPIVNLKIFGHDTNCITGKMIQNNEFYFTKNTNDIISQIPGRDTDRITGKLIHFFFQNFIFPVHESDRFTGTLGHQNFKSTFSSIGKQSVSRNSRIIIFRLNSWFWISFPVMLVPGPKIRKLTIGCVFQWYDLAHAPKNCQ